MTFYKHVMSLIFILCFLCRIEAQDASSITAMAYSKNGDLLAMGYLDGHIEILDVNTMQMYYPNEARGATVLFLGWSPTNNNILLTSNNSGIVGVYDVGNPASPDYWGRYLWSDMRAIAWLPDGSGFIASGIENYGTPEMQIFTAPEINPIGKFYGDVADSFAFSPDGSQVLIGMQYETYIRSMTPPDYPVLHSLRSMQQSGVRWTSWDNSFLVLMDYELLTIYSATTYELLWTYYHGLVSPYIKEIALRPNSTHLALIGDKKIIVFDFLLQKILLTISTEITAGAVAWSPDGQTLAYAADGLFIEKIPLQLPETISTPTPIPALVAEEMCGYDVWRSPSDLDLAIQEIESLESNRICLNPSYVYSVEYASIQPPDKDFPGGTAFSKIVTDVIIEGNNAVLERPLNADFFRFFAIAPTGHLTLRNLTLRGATLEEGLGAAILNRGQLTLDNVIFDNNCLISKPCEDGDAIYSNGGTVTIVRPILWGDTTPVPLTHTPTPVPSVTPIMMNRLTPVLLPSPSLAAQTSTNVSGQP